MKDFININLRYHKKKDAYIKLYISKDALLAKADFFPAREGGRPFTKTYIDTLLKKAGIVYGVEYKCIDDTFDECNESGIEAKDVIIARGDAPVEDSPAYFKINTTLKAASAPEELPGGKINYRSKSPFIMVKTGDCLAHLEPACAGKNGRTVRGGLLPFKKAERKELVEGNGICIQNDVIYATVPGLLVIKENTISVEGRLCLRAVNYSTGDINFSGEVVLEGPVSDGFSIHSGGDIIARDTLSVSDCRSRGNLRAQGGLIGRGAGALKVSGSMRARYIRNCTVACKGNIYIEKEIINSTVRTLGVLDISGGVLAASDVYALHGVSAADIGRKTARPARFFLGIDWTLSGKIKNDTQLLRNLTTSILSLHSFLKSPETVNEICYYNGKSMVYVTLGAAFRSSGIDALAAKIKKIELAMKTEYKKTKTRLEENSKISRIDYRAALVARGLVRAGTCIEICTIPYYVPADVRNIRFVFDAAAKKIAVLPNKSEGML